MSVEEHALEFTAVVRCYNGAFDGASQRVLDARAEVMAAIREVEPKAHVTYFPVEGTWQVHVWGRALSAHSASMGVALLDALGRVKQMPPRAGAE